VTKYTIEYMAEKVTAYRYAESVEIFYDDGQDPIEGDADEPSWTVRWGSLDVPDDDRAEEWCQVHDRTLRGALEEAYHGMYES
jgi:hypothetical protein